VKGWREFFGTGELMPLEEIERQFPNARRHVRSCLFISHAGPDVPIFSNAITEPLRSKYSHYAVFQYSSKETMKDVYKQLVLLALTYCKCSIVVCSERSSQHEWVFAEVDWLLHHKRPAFLLRLDKVAASKVHPGLGPFGRLSRRISTFELSQAEDLVRKIERFDLPKFPEWDFRDQNILAG